MPSTDRELISKWWNDAWTEGLWAASWQKSLDGLTAAQAAWSPPSAPGVTGERHSIWQFVLHMVFWREAWLRRLATDQRTTPEERATLNFPIITDKSEAAWAEARRRFEETQTKIAAALKTPSPAADPIMYFLPHDAYHFGQINYLRAMQGLKFIE